MKIFYMIVVGCLSLHINQVTSAAAAAAAGAEVPEEDEVTAAAAAVKAKSASYIQLPKENSQTQPVKNTSFAVIYGVKVYLNCPLGVKNALIADTKYCNVFHHCYQMGAGNVFTCEKGQAFDGEANGESESGVCNFEEMVDCAGKFILTENGHRMGQPAKSQQSPSQQSVVAMSPKDSIEDVEPLLNYQVNDTKSAKSFNNMMMPPSGMGSNPMEETISGIPFDCRGKQNGHFRDLRYCDIFHACSNGQQRKTYSCAQLGERVYFDETTKRCEFVRNNPSGCQSGSYFLNVMVSSVNSMIPAYEEPFEAWKQFIRSREMFSCVGKPDGSYASRWCNVFYRCFLNTKTEFLCPKMMNMDRLWWTNHGSSQDMPQQSSACVWPCETKRQCTSPGGILVEQGGVVSESVAEAQRVFAASDTCTEHINTDIFKVPDQIPTCNGIPDGAFQESRYCNVFHRCINGMRRDFQCAKATNSPYDLWWNQATNQCDWPCKVQCTKPIFGTQKLASQIQLEDRQLNEEECKAYNSNPCAQPGSNCNNNGNGNNLPYHPMQPNHP